MWILSKKFEDSRSFSIKKDNTHLATLPVGRLGYVETLITTVKPSRYRFIDSNRLIHSIVQSCLPDITESINGLYQVIQTIFFQNQPKKSF